jgi:hypothetical protein
MEKEREKENRRWRSGWGRRRGKKRMREGR